MTEKQAWNFIQQLTYDEKRQLLELLKRAGIPRVSTSERQVPPPDTHLRRYTHELHRNRNRRTLHDVIRRKQAESYGVNRGTTELNKRHGSVFGAVPFLFFRGKLKADRRSDLLML